MVVFFSSLKYFSGDVFLAGFTLDAEHGVVICLTVGDPILADIFGIKHFIAHFALEAAEVPVLVQRHQRLLIFKLLSTSTAIVHSLWGSRAVDWHRLSTFLTNALLPIKRHAVASWKRLLAGGTDKAAWMISLSQGRHNLPFDELLTAEAAGAVESLVIHSADILTLTHKKPSLSQVTSTNFANKALNVEVFVLHPEHLSFAGFATVLTGDGAALPLALLLLQGTVDSLLVKCFFFRHRLT